MPCPFTGPKMFCAGPNFLSQPKNLTAFSASSKLFVPAQKPILLNANNLFVWHKMCVTAKICKYIIGLAQKIWTSRKNVRTCKRTRHIFFHIVYYYRDIISKLKPYQKLHTQQRWSWIHTQGNTRLRGAFQSFWNYCLFPWTLRILSQSRQMALGVDTLEIFQMENGMEWWIKLSMKELTLVNVH